MILFLTSRNGTSNSHVSTKSISTREFLRYLGLSLALLAALLLLAPAPFAEVATDQEMELVCRNMLTETVALRGSWAGGLAPEISGVSEIRMGDTLLARYYSISPRGFVLVPVLKEMMPIKAYSDEADLDEKQEGGFLALVTEMLTERARLYTARYGSLEASQSTDGEAVFGRSQKAVWDKYAVSGRDFAARLTAATSTEEQGGPLLTSSWHQGAPYNDNCPMGDGGRCVVGCVATATAQIMAYWDYPATGLGSHIYNWDGDNSCNETPVNAGQLFADFTSVYDWGNIPDNCDGGCTGAEEAALAHLNYEVGVAHEMDYGRCGSGAYTGNAVQVLSNYFKYSQDVHREDRTSYDLAGWYNLVKTEIDAGRPAQYRIRSHSIVCDGYRDTDGQYQYHLNYGWGGSFNAWFVLDSLYCSWVQPDSVCPADEEYMVVDIHPETDVVLGYVGFELTEASGDGDGHADAGETVRLTATINNNGADALNTVGNLTAAGPYVSVNTGSASFDASIGWGVQSTSLTPFEIAILPGCPDPQVTWVEFTASADGGFSIVDTIWVFIGDTPGLSDDMESGEGFWRHEAVTNGYADQWHIETFRSHSSSTSWKVGGAGAATYVDFADAGLRTPPFLLPPNAVLSFWHFYNIEEGDPGLAWDGAIVMISGGDGVWTQLTPEGGYPRTIIANSSSPFEPDTPCYSASKDWTEAVFDLSSFSGVVQIMFRLGTDGGASEEGWYVDDVEIAGPNTPVGTPSSVEPMPGCNITFDQVTGAGNTAVVTTGSGPTLPEGYQPVPVSPTTYFDITTSATYTGDIEICLAYDDAAVTGDEAKVKLLHYDGSEWIDVTSSLDTSGDVVCGVTSSLSTFLIAEKLGCCLPPTVGDLDQSGVVDISDVSVLVDNQFISLTPLVCEAEGDLDFTGVVDVTDLSILIDNQFLTLTPLAPCP